MTVATAIRLIIALARVLRVNLVDLAAAYLDTDTCQQDLNELVMMVNVKGKVQ